MALALEFSARHQLMPAADAERAVRHLAAVGLPTRLSEVDGGAPDADTLMDLIAQDKKVKRGKLTFILARGIGAPSSHPMSTPRMCAPFSAKNSRSDDDG